MVQEKIKAEETKDKIIESFFERLLKSENEQLEDS